MRRAPAAPPRPRGRPSHGIQEVMVRTWSPHELAEAMAAAAKRAGIPAAEAWRRAARAWLEMAPAQQIRR